MEKTITIIVENGCVIGVDGMPDGWLYKIEDHDISHK